MLGNLAAWVTGALDNVFDYPQEDSEFENNLIDLQCGRTVFNDVPSKMRTELWASQLHKLGSAGSAAVASYSSLASSPLPSTVIQEIEKDTHRTFPSNPWLRGHAGQLAMLRVLRAYAVFDPEVGYTQGMNFLAGLFLAYLDEPQAFGALVLVMQDRGLRALYLPNDGMALLQVRLWQLGRLMPPRLSNHLENHAALPVLYASSWFLTCFSADFSMHFAARVMDLVVTDHYAAPFMKVAVHILERCEDELLKTEDLEDIIDYLRKDVPKWPRAKLQDLLTEALGQGWTARQSEVLKEINGAESVAEAVARVENNNNNTSSSNSEVETTSETMHTETEPPTTITPTTITPTTITTATPVKLPPPPSSRKDKVGWSKWKPTAPILNTKNIKIQTELSEIALDPALSRELSTYLGKNDSGANGAVPQSADNTKVTTETSLKVSSPCSPSQQTPAGSENAVTTAATKSTPPLSTGGSGGGKRSPAAGIPSPFASRSQASSSLGTHGTHSTFENSLSTNMGEFSDFTGASDSAAAATASGAATVAAAGVEGQNEQTTSWGQSAADSITYLLANFSMGVSGVADGGGTSGINQEKEKNEINLDASSSNLGLQSRESTAESPGMLPTPQMSGFGSWRVAEPFGADAVKQEKASGKAKEEKEEAAAATTESGKVAMMTSASSSAQTMSPANSKAVLLQQTHLNEFSASAKTPPKNRWT